MNNLNREKKANSLQSSKNTKLNTDLLIDLKYNLKQLLDKKAVLDEEIKFMKLQIKTINKSRMNSNVFKNIEHAHIARNKQ